MSREYELPAASGDRDRRIRDQCVVCGRAHDRPTSRRRRFASVFLDSQGGLGPPTSVQLSQLPVASETRQKRTVSKRRVGANLDRDDGQRQMAATPLQTHAGSPRRENHPRRIAPRRQPG